MTRASIDIYQEVTDTMIQAIESNTKPWSQGWQTTGGLQKRCTGDEYKGINQFLLGLYAGAKGYTSPFWLTFKQGKTDGLSVRKGEKGAPIVFVKQLPVDDENKPGEKKMIPLMKRYVVFNLDQMDGDRPAKYQVDSKKITPLDPSLLDKNAEARLFAAGADIRFGGDRAFYSPTTDHIGMPEYAQFTSPGSYLATLAHEPVHWTGHKSREDRDMSGGFKSPQYAKEELIAELGSAMLCAQLGVAGEHIDNHAAYLKSFLSILRGDKRAIFTAASYAQAACDRILDSSVEDQDGEEDIPFLKAA